LRDVDCGHGFWTSQVKWAVQAIRKPKEHKAPDILYGRWRQGAAEWSVDPDTLVREVTGRTANRNQDQGVSADAIVRLFDGLAGPEGLTATASTFTRPEVLVALGAGLAGAGRTELEELADRFLAKRAVSVVADRALEERRWSTPDLLTVEQRLVAAATGRTGEHTAIASHQAVREALTAHPTAGTDQQAMVRDLCQGGQGVALVVGRAGTGKTFALGIARHAWQLDGYRLLASAPTGIATMSLQGEGFEDVATCDRLLGDLDRGHDQLDPRTVLVVDEAGMVGSRKLGRLVGYAHQAQAKVVLVGDDRQLAAIDAGGCFRALRHRLGASELTENRRQQQAWEREALDLIRSGMIDEAVAAYQAHDRVVAADSKPAATLALLQDWWVAWQQADHDPAQEVVVLAARRGEVDRLNTACQELLAARGRLGKDRLQVEDRQLAVGDRIVCGHNAIGELGVANGSRGVVTALDPQRPDLDDPPGRQGRPRGAPTQVVSGWARPASAQPAGRSRLCHHRASRPGLDPGAGPGPAHRQRGRQLAVCAAVPGPPGHPPVRRGWPRAPGRRGAGSAGSGAAGRVCAAGSGAVAGWRSDPGHRHPTTLDLRRLSTAELRTERDRLRRQLDQAPRDRSREFARATTHREQAEAALAAHQLPDGRQPPGMLRWLRRGGDQSAQIPGGLAVATQQANRAQDCERELRHARPRGGGPAGRGGSRRPGPLGQGRHGRCARRASPAAAKHAARAPDGAGARAGRRPGRPGQGSLPRRRLISPMGGSSNPTHTDLNPTTSPIGTALATQRGPT
jgi:hypothetical protein